MIKLLKIILNEMIINYKYINLTDVKSRTINSMSY